MSSADLSEFYNIMVEVEISFTDFGKFLAIKLCRSFHVRRSAGLVHLIKFRKWRKVSQNGIQPLDFSQNSSKLIPEGCFLKLLTQMVKCEANTACKSRVNG